MIRKTLMVRELTSLAGCGGGENSAQRLRETPICGSIICM